MRHDLGSEPLDVAQGLSLVDPVVCVPDQDFLGVAHLAMILAHCGLKPLQPRHLELERDSTDPVAVNRLFGRQFEANDMAEKMKATKVYRGGKTQRTLLLETSDVSMDFKRRYERDGEPPKERKVLTLDFSISSKGGGITNVHVAIEKEDFGMILDTMVKADRIEAMATMSGELAKQLSAGK